MKQLQGHIENIFGSDGDLNLALGVWLPDKEEFEKRKHQMKILRSIEQYRKEAQTLLKLKDYFQLKDDDFAGVMCLSNLVRIMGHVSDMYRYLKEIWCIYFILHMNLTFLGCFLLQYDSCSHLYMGPVFYYEARNSITIKIPTDIF